jgi:hypothetical protein
VSSRSGSRRCGVIHPSGQPCRAWAMRGSDPPRCGAHSGGAARAGNKNAWKPGAHARTGAHPVQIHDIGDVVADLQRKMARLSELIDGCEDPEALIKLMSLHAQVASRLGRLERDKRALDGKAADGLLDAIGKALDEISTELGIKL